MTLNHSKTWPVSTMAVVQLRVDPSGRAYSTLRQEPPMMPPDAEDGHPARDVTREVLLMDKSRVDRKVVNSVSITAETVSTLVEDFGDGANECPIHSRQYQLQLQEKQHQDRNAELRYCIERFHVLALGRIDEESEPNSFNHVSISGELISRSPFRHIRYADETTSDNNSVTCGDKDGVNSVDNGVNDGVNGANRLGVSVNGDKPDLQLDGNCNKQCLLNDVPLDARKTATLYRHYYPEGGWGWLIIICSVLVHILNHGLQLSCSLLAAPAYKKFQASYVNTAGWLGALSTGVALLVSPVTIAFCRRKSTRVTAVMGGLVTALGCLFTSFASQFHQLFFSYGTVVGVGVGITRDCSTLMVAQYFKRRREFVEIFIVSGSGLGIAVMSAFIKGAISAIGWRLGLQAVTGVVFLTFILGTFYRSASLYHPQRRAILHLKNQKRKIKDKNKVDDRPPFFDFSTLRSKTVRILLVSTGISAFGINTPIFYLAHQAEEEGLGDTAVLLQAYLGLAWTLGCAAFGLLVVHNSVECRIARQYLCQAAVFMCGLSILALTAVHGNYHGYVMFAWIYGIFCGGYHYSLKMYTYERVRARNFARTWGFVQCSQAIPIAIGVPISGYMNVGCGGKAGYYFSSTCVLVGSLTLFFIDLHRRNLSRHKHTRANGTRHLCVSENCPQRRRLSFTQEPENDGNGAAAGAAAAALVLGAELAGPAPGDGLIDNIGTADKPELTCISEEGIADMDLPDNLLDDLDYIGDCITSCNKVENYLMLSEFENNLIAEMPVILDRRGRRWSLARSRQTQGTTEESSTAEDSKTNTSNNGKWRVGQQTQPNSRVITVIDEASV